MKSVSLPEVSQEVHAGWLLLIGTESFGTSDITGLTAATNGPNRGEHPSVNGKGSILPRIQSFLPTGRCLEIAPGFGRWTQFLIQQCDELIAVDLTPRCVEACQERFAGHSNFSCHLNDGRSLDMVDDGSIDFVFSFDSLVHAEASAIDSYLQQLSRKLTKDGVGFIHHSNIGRYAKSFWYRKVPLIKSIVRRIAPVRMTHGRAFSMTADKFENLSRNHGLCCISQELINWNMPPMIDAISVFTREDSLWAQENRILRNPNFMKEADRIKHAPESDFESVLTGLTAFRYAKAA